MVFSLEGGGGQKKKIIYLRIRTLQSDTRLIYSGKGESSSFNLKS